MNKSPKSVSTVSPVVESKVASIGSSYLNSHSEKSNEQSKEKDVIKEMLANAKLSGK